MRSMTPHRLWSLVLGLPLACGTAAKGDLYDSDPGGSLVGAGQLGGASTTEKLTAAPLTFPGGGSSGAARPLSPALAPDTSNDCNPQPTASALPSAAEVQTVCFYGADSDVPAATIQQIVEVVGNAEWVHLRLTLNPDFVDNTYGETAIGWGSDDGAAAPVGDQPAPPAGDAPPPPAGDAPPPPAGDAPPPPAGDAPPPPVADAGVPPAPPPGPGAEAPPPADAGAPGAPRPPRGERPAPGAPAPGAPAPGGRGGPGKGGHTFNDLVGSDHAEIQLLDSDGLIAVHFKIDYLSESASAPSGFASLGVSGGEGKLIVGEPEWILATATSIDRNLNACALGDFLENSPATDQSYTPNPAASDWDYRVAYEIWVSTDAFAGAGFGSALIENVHASPSKADGDTADVLPAPCPIDPRNPELAPAPLPEVLREIR
jgi:hypothetical protein